MRSTNDELMQVCNVQSSTAAGTFTASGRQGAVSCPAGSTCAAQDRTRRYAVVTKSPAALRENLGDQCEGLWWMCGFSPTLHLLTDKAALGAHFLARPALRGPDSLWNMGDSQMAGF